MPFGFTHKPLVALAHSCVHAFFRDIEVYGVDNVPTEGPIIFACSHVNMAVDPAILSNTLPHGHLVHYWVKDSLFKNKYMGAMLLNAGNIPVDRKTKNNQKLFKGTFEAMALGESIGVFPEGTSHTEPHLIPFKDGTSWAALEYVRYLQGTEENKGTKKGKKAVIVPVAIGYVDKSKYRSRIAVHYCPAISMDKYEADFVDGDDAKRRAAVKQLTKATELGIWKETVNAPDWDTAFAAQMARELLWKYEKSINLADFIQISQTLVDLFTTKSNPRISALRTKLTSYHRLLSASRLSNEALVDLPLPSTLDPNAKLPLPTRLSAIWLLIKDSLMALYHLPFFFVPMLINLPIYGVGTLGAHLVEDELETQAQMKIVFGMLLTVLTMPVLFFTLWAVFRSVPLGAVLAAGVIWLLRRFHSSLIDENYSAMKRLVAAWRILIGVWLPRSWEMSLPSFIASAATFAPDPPKIAGLPPNTEPEKYRRPKHLPSRLLVRSVLRVRAEAARELAIALSEIEAQDAQVDASFWLADEFGGEVLKTSKEDEAKPEWERPLPRGVRGGREVVRFLRARGARLASSQKDERHWAAASGGETDLYAETDGNAQ